MAYATVDDLEAGWRELTAKEKARAEVLLERASALIDSLTDTTNIDKVVLTTVCCSVVQRVMQVDDYDGIGLSRENITAGSYIQSYTYANPSGDMYLTKTEKQLLGLGKNAARAYKVAIHTANGELVEW